MTTESIWMIMLLGGAGTFLSRYSFFWLSGKRQLSEKWGRILRFVPPAVLAALIAPMVVMPGFEAGDGLMNPRFMAGVIAIIVAWKAKGVMTTFVVGMASLWLLQWGMI